MSADHRYCNHLADERIKLEGQLTKMEQSLKKRIARHAKFNRMKVERDQVWVIRTAGIIDEARAILALFRRIRKLKS